MKMRKFLTVICFIVLAQPSAFAQLANDVDLDTLIPGSSGEPTTAVYPTGFPARGGDVDWGLALSGGGLRSAAFSIGVLKALHQQKLLDHIDVISSVSGGGYASYWMYSKYDGDPATRFGDGAFDDSVFTKNVCDLARKSEFLPLRRMIGGLFSSDDSAFRKYREAIEYTFGANDNKTRDQKRNVGEEPLLPFTAFNQKISATGAPYFILNTTIAKDHTKGKTKYNIERSFEIGPTYRGNSVFGFAEWAGDPAVKTWCGGVALSAAAIRFKLARKMPNESGGLRDAPKEITMYDGGFSENLAALPLIQRRMKNIIIVDAENDAAYKFPSYQALKKYLWDAHKITLGVEKIDGFLSNTNRGKTFKDAAVAKGFVKYQDGAESTVYYIKMSRPETIFGSKGKGLDVEGKPLPRPKRSKTRPTVCDNGFPTVTRESLRTGMLSYSQFINETWTWRYLFKALPYINYNFPELATVDQTYYRDQLEAFIGLGYLETLEMKAYAPLLSSNEAH
jgi:hypothetical protein